MGVCFVSGENYVRPQVVSKPRFGVVRPGRLIGCRHRAQIAALRPRTQRQQKVPGEHYILSAVTSALIQIDGKKQTTETPTGVFDNEIHKNKSLSFWFVEPQYLKVFGCAMTHDVNLGGSNF